jgi:hypothetical protein
LSKNFELAARGTGPFDEVTTYIISSTVKGVRHKLEADCLFALYGGFERYRLLMSTYFPLAANSVRAYPSAAISLRRGTPQKPRPTVKVLASAGFDSPQKVATIADEQEAVHVFRTNIKNKKKR